MAKLEQLPFEFTSRQAYEREDFWVTDANAEAVAWLDKWPNWGSNFLAVLGPIACGKTHLLQVWKKEAKAKEIKLDDLKNVNIEDLLESSDVLVMDNLSLIIGDLDLEKKFFHIYNSIKEKNGSLLIASSLDIKDLPFTLPDLKSRLLSIPVVSIKAPDENLMAVVLTKLFSDKQMFVSQEVIKFIVLRSERSFSAIRELVEKIDHKALSDKRAVTIPLVKQILEGV